MKTLRIALKFGQKTPKISNCVREFRFSKSVKI